MDLPRGAVDRRRTGAGCVAVGDKRRKKARRQTQADVAAPNRDPEGTKPPAALLGEAE